MFLLQRTGYCLRSRMLVLVARWGLLILMPPWSDALVSLSLRDRSVPTCSLAAWSGSGVPSVRASRMT